jgi:hypothetical protein
LRVLTDPAQLLDSALFWSALPLTIALREFPTLLARRLVDFGCDPETGKEWAAIVSAKLDAAG